MGTLSEIQHRKQIDHPFIVEQLDLPDYEMEDLLDTNDWYYSGQGMYRNTKFLDNERCPALILELCNKYKMNLISAFSSIDEHSRNGFDAHSDNYEICAVNLIGDTRWNFRDCHFDLTRGTVLYIPKNIEHSVSILSEERFSVGMIR